MYKKEITLQAINSLDNIGFNTLSMIANYILLKILSKKSKRLSFVYEDILGKVKSFYDEYKDVFTIFDDQFILSFNGSKNLLYMQTEDETKLLSVLYRILSQNYNLTSNEFKLKLFCPEEGFIDCLIGPNKIQIKDRVYYPSNLHNLYTSLISASLCLKKIRASYEISGKTILSVRSTLKGQDEKYRIKALLYEELENKKYIIPNPFGFAQALRKSTQYYERTEGPFYLIKENEKTFIGFKTKDGELVKEDEIIDTLPLAVSLLTNEDCYCKTKKSFISIENSSMKYGDTVIQKLDTFAKIRLTFLL